MTSRLWRHGRYTIGILVLAAWTASFASATAADDIKVPTDAVAKAAFDVLEKSCARCHQEGRLTARERPARNFGFILKLDELAANPNYILPGNPYGSKLFKQIVDKEIWDLLPSGVRELTKERVGEIEAFFADAGPFSAVKVKATSLK